MQRLSFAPVGLTPQFELCHFRHAKRHGEWGILHHHGNEHRWKRFASIYIQVLASGGSLTITPTSREGEVNSTLTDITMSYGHAISNYGWTSGVSNASSVVNNAGTVAGSDIVTWDNGDVAIAWARPIYGSGSTVSHVLALSVYSGGSWSTQDIDTASRTGYKPSMEIDKDGALHIAYIDRDNTRLRYATNALKRGVEPFHAG